MYGLAATRAVIFSSRAPHLKDGKITKPGCRILWEQPHGSQAIQMFEKLCGLRICLIGCNWIPSTNEGDDFPSLQELQIQGCPELIGSLLVP